MKTIFGVATAITRSGVAVIRISGNGALNAARELGTGNLEPRKAKLCKLAFKREAIDEILAIYFKGPHSFTGEDVVELHTHGSRAVIKKILAILGAMPDLRMAEPGEFSRRAFENGKMDLLEAEGLADLIDAETESQHRQALRQMQGQLGHIYEKWRKEIIEILAFVEAYIDFPDEDLPQELIDRLTAKIENLKAEIKNYLTDNRRGEKIREGIYVVIIGAPNVGKSSLLNYLAGRDAAIVSEHAGTTRDVIEVQMEISGFAVTIADTAGLRETTDEIESEGIKRARDRAKDADLKIIMLEAGTVDKSVLTFADEDSIVVVNKIDRAKSVEKNALNISIKTGDGLDQMLAALSAKISKKFELNETPLITRARHREALSKALASLENFSTEKPIELMGEDLRYAASQIGRITGKIDVDDILDVIFSQFCIGK